jgi:hypothetical protein
MNSDVKNGRVRLKEQARLLGAHPDCLRGREHSCPSCRRIMDDLIDHVRQAGEPLGHGVDAGPAHAPGIGPLSPMPVDERPAP